VRLPLFALSLLTLITHSSLGAIIITEVHSMGSQGLFGRDWFEISNTGAAAVNLTGWKIDDSSGSGGTALAAALQGVPSIQPGQSVVFVETANVPADLDAFKTFWFGASVPAGFTIGSYTGSGLGFSSTGDAVYVFDATDTNVANVSFGLGSNGFTFENSDGLNGISLTTLSQVGVNGAFLSATGNEVGSPGITAVPEPSGFALLGLSGLLGSSLRRRRR
jgi:hypothetical protein